MVFRRRCPAAPRVTLAVLCRVQELVCPMEEARVDGGALQALARHVTPATAPLHELLRREWPGVPLGVRLRLAAALGPLGLLSGRPP